MDKNHCRRYMGSLSVALPLLIGSTFSASSFAQEPSQWDGADASVCYRTTLGSSLDWPLQGKWISDDPAFVQPKGSGFGKLALGRLRTIDDHHVYQDGGVLQGPCGFHKGTIEVFGDYPVPHTPDLHRAVELLVKDEPVTATIRTLHTWSPLSSGDFLALADLKTLEGNRSSFVSITADDIREVLLPDGINTEGVAFPFFHLNGFQPMAVTRNGSAFVLIQGQDPHLAKLSPDRRRLTRFAELPDGFNGPFHIDAETADLPEFRTRTKVLQQVERSAMVVGLVASGSQDLHLVAKSAANDAGETDWFLFQVDTNDAFLGPPTRIPSSAAHMSVIPGEDHWAFVESSGPVVGVGALHVPYLKASSVLVVHSSEIDAFTLDPNSFTRSDEVAQQPGFQVSFLVPPHRR